MKYIFHFILIFALSECLSAQNQGKQFSSIRVKEEITVDGKLTEASWTQKEKATDFIQREPLPGVKSAFDTEVHFLYDNNAVYIGARLFDPEPDKILKEFSLRDQVGNADNFTVFFDTYSSGLNGFLFRITASGVQNEAVVTNNEEDKNWNAVWESAVSIGDGGWYLEIKIPYSSLRFPDKVTQDWKVQFAREIRRLRESSNWSPVDPTIAGWVNQSGTVTEIQNVKSPVRLSLTPYLSSYLNTTYDPNNATTQKLSSGTAYSAGLDLKYGINDAFTLDMTLIPDFGQVISDRQVLNLSPFEVFFEENRQFFTEGTELFNRGRLFYSRRVGGLPLHYFDVDKQLLPNEMLKSNPVSSQLFNASKISGRTSSGLGIGGFNAIVGEAFAIAVDAEGRERNINTNPLTNYNAIVVDQNLKNNSFVALMNTNVSRKGSDYDTNVTGGFLNLKTKDQRYFFNGQAVLTRQFFESQTVKGHSYMFSGGKLSGNWTYEVGHGVESDKYNPNDMGFLLSPNKTFYFANGEFSEYKPKNEKLLLYKFNGSSTYSRLYKPDVFSDFFVELNNFILWKSRFGLGLNARLEPIATYDFFEPRTKDFSKFVRFPSNYTFGLFISSDYRKPFAYDVRSSYRWFDAAERNTFSLGVEPRFRFNDNFSLFTSTNVTLINSEPGYVNKAFVNGGVLDLDEDDILIGKRNRLIFENTLSGRYIFNSVMGVNLRVRHYWAKVIYSEFGTLSDEGYLSNLPFDGKGDNAQPIFDRNINIFNIDLQYNWRFAPGSDIIFVWKNEIFNNDQQFQRNYVANLGGLFDASQSNNFSVRFLYFLDYLFLFPRKES